MATKPDPLARRVSLVYGLAAAAYILCSDWLVANFIPDAQQISNFQSYKGLGFVGLTAALLYAVLNLVLRQRAKETANRQQAEALLHGQKQTLEMIASGAPLAKTLDTLLRLIERESPEMLCSILLLDGQHLRHGAAPSLPADYVRAVDGTEIGPQAGSCGTAAFRREPVIVEDIARDPLWEKYRDLALRHGLRACWSTPICDAQARVLGTFAVYFRTPLRPAERHRRLIEAVTHTAAVAILRQREEAALRKSEERYRTLTEQAADALFVHDESGQILEVNRRACESLGFSREELLQKCVTDLEQDYDRTALEQVTRQLQPGQARTLIGSHQRKNGSRFPVEVRLSSFDVDGRRRFHALCRDITERKRAADALEMFRTLVDRVNDAIEVIDPETGRFLDINEKACADLGYAREELLSLSVGDVDPGMDPTMFKVNKEKLWDAGALILESVRRRKDGSTFPVEVNMKWVWLDRDYMVAVVRDISERKKNEAALRSSEERLRACIDNTPNVAVQWYDNQGRVLFWNAASEVLFGWTGAEALGKTLDQLMLDKSQAAALLQAFHEVSASGKSVGPGEFQFHRRDGSTGVCLSTIFTIPAPDGSHHFVCMDVDLTERKRAEEAVRRSEQQYASLVNNIEGIVWEADPQTLEMKFVSFQAQRILGYPVPKWTASRTFWQDHLHPEDREVTVAHRREQSQRGESHDVQYRMLAADGRVVWIQDFVTVVADGGSPAALRGVMADITERKVAQEAIQHERQQLRTLIDLLPDVIYVKDTESRFIVANQALARRFGKTSPTEVLGLSDLDFFPAEQAALYRDNEQEVLAGKPVINDECQVVFPDGQVRTVLTTKIALCDDKGVALGLVGVGRDISERKAAETALRKNEEFFRSLIENTSDLITVLNGRGIITFQSPSSERIMGYKPDQLIGQNCLDYIHPEDTTRVRKALEQTRLNPGMQIPAEVRFRHQSGEWRTLQAMGKSIPGQAEDGFIVVNSRDLTETRKLEEQFRQSQKMEAIGQLAGGVAHDLNNILTVVHMQLDLLKHGDPLSAIQLESVVDIEKAARRAADLTRQLLMFSRRQAAQKTNLDLNAVVTNITKMLQRILGEDVGMHISYAPQPLPVHADTGMMEQILMNLAVNSRDAMPDGGRLVIETSVVELDAFAASQRAQARAGRFACLAVSDTGSGIPKEILPRIFEPFFTTKDVGKGTGLGLATVFGILQQHHGWINADSEVGRGTTFRMYLPLQAATADPGEERQAAGAMRGGHETILLVEDEQSLRVLTRNVLTRLGYRVLEATTGVTALDVWKEHREQIRLLLTDLVMPDGMTGRELAEQLGEADPKLKIIYTSGYSRDIAGSNFPLQDGVNFLSKPFQAAKLAQTVRNCLDG
jgi:two-component system, cell cycle sensor histidine kinase and response regulator CckA